MSRQVPIALTLVAATLGLLQPAGAQQVERYVFTAERVAVYDLAGEIRVEPGTGKDLVVEVTRSGRDAARLTIERGPIMDFETLRVVYPEDEIVYPLLSRGSSSTFRVLADGTFGDDHEHDRARGHDRRRGRREGRGRWEGREITIHGSGSGLEAHADLRILVPEGARIAVHVGVGKAAVSNVNGEISVDAASAPVTAQGVRGLLNIDVGSGSVSATDVQADLSIDTGSGDVELARVHGRDLSVDTGSGRVTATDVTADRASLDTGSGDVRLSQVRGAELHFETGSGDVDVDLASEARSMSVETGSGNVLLRVPDTLGATIDVDTGSGGVETDLPMQVQRWSKDHFTGRLGDGSGRIDVETGSGRVKLVKRSQ